MDDNLFSQPPGEASFVAIGDSFTEGLNDAAPGGGDRGWADRLAGNNTVGTPGPRYAHLPVGGNDIIRPGGDPDTLAKIFDGAVARLRASGSRVLMFTGADLVGFPVMRLLRGRIAAYNMHLRSIADARGCDLVDLWSMRFLRDLSAWSPDRLHLTSQSHQRVALRAAEVLGIGVTEDWRLSAGEDAFRPLAAVKATRG